MTRERPGPKPTRAVATYTENIRSATDTSGRVGQRSRFQAVRGNH